MHKIRLAECFSDVTLFLLTDPRGDYELTRRKRLNVGSDALSHGKKQRPEVKFNSQLCILMLHNYHPRPSRYTRVPNYLNQL